MTSCLAMARPWGWVKVRKRLPSISRSWTSTSPLGRDRRCHAIQLLLRSLVLILTIAFALLLLHLLLLPRSLIKEESVECRDNQSVFVCYASTSMKITSSTELVLW